MAITFNTLESGITRKLGNRADLLTVDANGVKDMYRWIAESVKELTDNYSFEELHVTGPTLALTALQSVYTKNFWTNTNEDWTDVVTFWFELDSSNHIGWPLQYRDNAVVEPISKLPGPSTLWSQHGASIIIGLQPDKAYNTYWRYQKKHTFSSPYASTDVISMPDSWQEIVEYSAALRGAIEKRAQDYIQLYDTLLNGDEDYKITGGKKGRPGLILGRVSQEKRNKGRNSRQLTLVMGRY